MFFGWYIVIASAAIQACIGGISFYGFTALVNPIAAAFGWSYAQISLAMTLRGAEIGVMTPVAGILVDRFPARRLVMAGVIIMGLGLLSLSRISNLPMFYVSFFIMALGTSLCMHTVPTTVIIRWFKRNVSKATGLLAIGAGLGGVLVPLVAAIIDTYDWRTSLMILAAIVWTIGIPLSLLYRSRPEDYGLLPDGKPQDSAASNSRKTQDFGIRARKALRMRPFWHIGPAFMLQGAGISVVILHVMPYLDSVGIGRETASTVAMLIPLISLPARFVLGWSADIFKKKYVIAVAMSLSAIGLFLFSIIGGASWGLLAGFLITFGIGLGGLTPLMAPILREHFGTRNFGTILGAAGIFSTLGMIITPTLAGWIFDTRGTYEPIWLILCGMVMLGVALILTVPRASSQA